MKARDITAFLHGKSATIVAAVFAFVSCVVAWQRSAVIPIEGDLGVGFPSANMWIASARTSAIVNMALTAVVALAMLYINRVFNVLRSLTSLVATMFLVLQAAVPSALGQFYGGTILALLVMVCCGLLFSAFGERLGQRHVFLGFFLFAGAAFTQVGYLFFLPAILLGVMQMRIFSLKSFLAALLGTITPPWILFGLGLVTPDHLQWPGMAFELWHLFESNDMVPTFVTIGATLLTGIGFTVANQMKILSYNSRVRAYNGFLTMMLIYTSVLVVLNFGNFMFYVPLLNCLVAYQIGHFFTYRRSNRSYVAILAVASVYVALYIWAVAA